MSIRNESKGSVPLIATGVGGESRFTYGDLLRLNDAANAYRLPLSVIALIDMNAFFAQVEQVRLGLSDDDPVVCVQWNSLIAVSYAARKFGIGRMDSIQSAKQKCPGVILAHAAVFKKGKSYWSYYDGLPHQASSKVSLDPYRREGRKIVKLFQRHCDFVEKASVDESYLDLGRLVYEKLMHYFPQLTAVNQEDPSHKLPPIPQVLPEGLQWKGDVIKSDVEGGKLQNHILLSESQKGVEPAPTISDWNDICMVIGSQVLYDLRKIVYDELGYTTSGGLASNKLVAKLAAGFIKPDFQTIIRDQLRDAFLGNFKLNDISGMGGKLGDSVNERLNVPLENPIAFIRDNFTLEDLQQEFKEDIPFASKLYQMVRGDYKLELTQRVEIKSMMSRKNFMAKAPVSSLGDAYDWVKVFVGDLYNRMIELDDESMNVSMIEESNKTSATVKRPKTLSIQITTVTYSSRSKQTQIPLYTSLDRFKEVLEIHALKILKEIIESACNLSLINGNRSVKDILLDPNLQKIKICQLASMGLTISNFVKLSNANMIDTFVGKSEGQVAKQLPSVVRTANPSSKEDPIESNPVTKKQKMDKEYISRLFADFEKVEASATTAPSKGPVKPKPSLDKEYIDKLFEDFRKSETPTRTPLAIDESNSSESSKKPKILKPEKSSSPTIAFNKGPSPADKEYQKELFSKFHSETVVNLAIRKLDTTKVKKIKTNKNDILDSLKSKSELTPVVKLSKGDFCPKCNYKVQDEAEHNDYHFALELSEKLNS